MGTAFGGLAGSTESHENQTKLQFREVVRLSRTFEYLKKKPKNERSRMVALDLYGTAVLASAENSYSNSLTDDERSMLFSVKQDTRRYLGAG
jgi:hypothetical protein